MNSRHLIDRAEFDTTYATAVVGAEQQAGVDEFIKSDLLRIIDEVFDDIERKSGKHASLLRMDRLEIDLGELRLQDYRQQMPQRLRRQLWQALDNARYGVQALRSTAVGQSEDSAAVPSLFYYLRYGYLPGQVAVVDNDELEARLLQIIATRPARLVEFIVAAPQRDQIIARLKAQFATSLVDRVMQLLTTPEAGADRISDVGAQKLDQDAVNDTVPIIDLWRTQLQTALMTGTRAEFERLWQEAMQADPAALAEILRDIGQPAMHRRQLLQRLSVSQFAELLRLLEPSAHQLVLSVLAPGHWLATLVPGSASGSAASDSGLRELLLGYLLVERGARFDREAFISSLLRQIMAANSEQQAEAWPTLMDKLETAVQGEGIAAELARLMLLQAEQLATQPTIDLADVYRRYERLAAMFSSALQPQAEAPLLADIDVLASRAPWLLLRLLRELQSGDDGWRRTLTELGAPLLERLVYGFLVLINQTVATERSAGSRQLVAAIRRNATQTPDPRSYYADILACLICGDAIDFDVVGLTAETGGGQIDAVDKPATGDGIAESEAERDAAIASLLPMGARAATLLQVAELLTTASLFIGLALPVRQLQAIKWRLVKTYASETGKLFNQGYFLLAFVDLLIEQAGIDNVGRFYALLGQALLQNSLPATRELTRQLIEQLDAIAARSAISTGLSDTESAQTASSPREEAIDEIAPDEDIHVANAGLVLLAPWLPRLFEQLGFTEEGEFKNHDLAERAVHCLQFLVDSSVASPEYQLVLNKLLCGIKPGKPIRRRIELTTTEIEQLESLLAAVSGHWKALENTSIDGLRESFLQRGGRLQRKGDAWQLAVESRAFDMLLDQLPWSYSTIRFGWMARVIYVEWR